MRSQKISCNMMVLFKFMKKCESYFHLPSSCFSFLTYLIEGNCLGEVSPYRSCLFFLSWAMKDINVQSHAMWICIHNYNTALCKRAPNVQHASFKALRKPVKGNLLSWLSNISSPAMFTPELVQDLSLQSLVAGWDRTLHPLQHGTILQNWSINYCY